MTFRIDQSLARVVVSAACLGAAWGCSSRSPEPETGAAPASSAPSATDSSAAAAPASPAPADTAKAPVDTAQASADTASAPAASAAGSAVADSQYLKYDPATKTVTFELVAGPFDFNHFTNGGGTLTVPPGTANVWNFVQDDGTPHSAEVASGTGPIPNSGGDPAIPRAYTNKVVEGLPQGAKDVIRFTAPDTGTYRIVCGVPGHALSGMWIWFKIDPKATAPTFGATPK